MTYQFVLVDNDAVDRALIHRYLKKTSLDVELTEFSTSQAGLAYLANNTIDCLLLDSRLPDIDSLAFLDALAAQQSMTELAIIMLTGMKIEAVEAEVRKRGVADYLVKSELTPMALQRAVTHAIDPVSARQPR